MRLLLVRHAIAVPRGTPGIAEDERPLTERGVRRFTRAARGLRAILPRPDVLLTSPLRRAHATAALLAAAWHGPAPVSSAALASGELAALERLVRAQRGRGLSVLVGHEPHLSTLLARLLGATQSEPFVLRKGGAAWLELDDGQGRLIALLPPRLLRRLGR